MYYRLRTVAKKARLAVPIGLSWGQRTVEPVPDRDASAEARLIELESKLSYQEMALLETSKVLAGQEARIARLEATISSLSDKIKELSREERSSLPANERPPHY